MLPPAWKGTLMAEAYAGLLAIGDPHVEGRVPGFRKDDYPAVILEKLAWCIDHAVRNHLLPVLLGDLFDKPRDNPNWILGRLLDLFHVEVIGLYGNHDVHYNPELTDDDSLSLLVKAGRLRLVSGEAPWRWVALALMEYRRGHWAGAAQRCQSLPSADTNPARIAATRLILAMSWQNLGKSSEAAAAFKQGCELIEAKFHTGLASERESEGYWFDWATVQILQREAAGLVKSAP